MNEPTIGRFEFSRAELWADGAVHVLGVALALGAVVALMMRVPPSTGDLVPAAIYSFALMAVLTISAIYNMWPLSPMKWLIRRFDHSSIYLLIAGTYTPFLTKLGQSFATQALLVVVWAVAIVGSVLKVVLPGRFDRLSIALYLLLGWSGVVVWQSIAQLPTAILWLMFAGALIYSIGVVFLLWDNLPFQNAIWHVLVLVASACFYEAVFQAYAIAPSAQALDDLSRVALLFPAGFDP